MAQPPLVLEPPTPLPVPPGLFSVADVQDMPAHGQNFGAIWVPDTCGPGEISAAPCQTPPYASFTLDGLEACAMAFPFTAYATLVTGAIGVDDQEAVRRVRQRLINTEQTIAERALSDGTATLFTGVPNYAGKAADGGLGAGTAGVAGGIFQQMAAAGAPAGYFNLTTATSMVDAVSQLEQSAATNYYGEAILHARPRLAAYAGDRGQFRVTGLPATTTKTNQYTQNLNCWNFGNGYAGTGPAREAPDATSEYMWATGRIRIWRDADIWVSPPDQLLNRTTNQRGLYAVRQYLMGIECFAAVIKVTRG